jgi:hypothetical protein
MASAIGSFLPSTVKMVLRAAAPLAADFVVRRFTDINSTWAGLGTLVILNRNVSILEAVVDTALYLVYKLFVDIRLLQWKQQQSDVAFRKLLKDGRSAVAGQHPSSSLLSPLAALQQKFNNAAPCFLLGDAGDRNIHYSNIHRCYFEEGYLKGLNEMFQLAQADMNNLYDELLRETDNVLVEQRPQEMARLLTQKTRHYERFCDPRKPTFWFYYHFVRGCVYFTRQSGKVQTHPYQLSAFETEPYFRENTSHSQWRQSYNSMVDKWAPVAAFLPTEMKKWMHKDLAQMPADDRDPVEAFKIHYSELKLGLI